MIVLTPEAIPVVPTKFVPLAVKLKEMPRRASCTTSGPITSLHRLASVKAFVIALSGSPIAVGENSCMIVGLELPDAEKLPLNSLKSPFRRQQGDVLDAIGTWMVTSAAAIALNAARRATSVLP